MDIQVILVFLLFSIAVLYLGRTVYLNSKPNKKKSSCGGCGHCGVDFSKVPEVKPDGEGRMLKK